MEEIWKACAEFPGYEVSNRGAVRSYRRKVGIGRGTKSIIDMTRIPKILKAYTEKGGHLTIHLATQGRRIKVSIHCLVLESFVGPCPIGEECRHLNDIPSDNRWPENILWGTHSENVKDAFRNGHCTHRGERNTQSKLTEASVREIKKRLSAGDRVEKMAIEYGVSQPTISMIKAGRNWSHVELAGNL